MPAEMPTSIRLYGRDIAVIAYELPGRSRIFGMNMSQIFREIRRCDPELGKERHSPYWYRWSFGRAYLELKADEYGVPIDHIITEDEDTGEWWAILDVVLDYAGQVSSEIRDRINRACVAKGIGPFPRRASREEMGFWEPIRELGKNSRKYLTRVIKSNGIKVSLGMHRGASYALITDAICIGLYGCTTRQALRRRGLSQGANLRDHLDVDGVRQWDMAEWETARLLESSEVMDLNLACEVAKKVARDVAAFHNHLRLEGA